MDPLILQHPADGGSGQLLEAFGVESRYNVSGPRAENPCPDDLHGNDAHVAFMGLGHTRIPQFGHPGGPYLIVSSGNVSVG